MPDWSTIASLATAAGTLVLAVATFMSVRSANRSARLAERTLLAGLRPVLAASRLDDPTQKVMFADAHWLHIPGGSGAVDVSDEAVYLGISLRNVGTGMAVLHGWHFRPGRQLADVPHAHPDEFRRLTRDLYIPSGDIGFWQGAFRDPASPEFAAARDAVGGAAPFTVELLYGDHEGGQRAISRFMLTPIGEKRWLASVGRHWNIDRPDPR